MTSTASLARYRVGGAVGSVAVADGYAYAITSPINSTPRCTGLP